MVPSVIGICTMPMKGCNADCCRLLVSHERCLPGITTGYSYKMVSFSADREYGPDEGWQRVSYRKKGGRKARRYVHD